MCIPQYKLYVDVILRPSFFSRTCTKATLTCQGMKEGSGAIMERIFHNKRYIQMEMTDALYC
jgi:uncharacterized protein (DUF2141 family)